MPLPPPQPSASRKWIKPAIIATLSTLLLTFAVQVYCETVESYHSPATVLATLKLFLEHWFRRLGDWLAFLGSYLRWIKFENIWKAFVHLVEPTFGIVTAWVYIGVGYFESAWSYTNAYTIYIGTILPIALGLILMWRYTNWLGRARSFLTKVLRNPIVNHMFVSVLIVFMTVCFLLLLSKLRLAERFGSAKM